METIKHKEGDIKIGNKEDVKKQRLKDMVTSLQKQNEDHELQQELNMVIIDHINKNKL